VRIAVVHTGKGESEALGGIAGAVAREFVAQGRPGAYRRHRQPIGSQEAIIV